VQYPQLLAPCFAFEASGDGADKPSRRGDVRKLKEAPMLRYIAPIAFTLFPVAAASAATPTTVAEQDGYKFEYTTQVVDGGKVVISGKMLNPSEPFTYTVEPNGRVHGQVDGAPVDFAISGKQRNELLAEVQADSAIAVADAGSGSN
jgi:hypothetical protein